MYSLFGFTTRQVRREDGHCLAEEDPKIHDPADAEQPLLFHPHLQPRHLHVEPSEDGQDDGRQGADQLPPFVFYVHSHHHDGGAVRNRHVQRRPEILQAQQESRKHPEEQQDHESVSKGSRIRCALSRGYIF